MRFTKKKRSKSEGMSTTITEAGISKHDVINGDRILFSLKNGTTFVGHINRNANIYVPVRNIPRGIKRLPLCKKPIHLDVVSVVNIEEVVEISDGGFFYDN